MGDKMLKQFDRLACRLEYIFLAFLFVNPVLDLLNGSMYLLVRVHFSNFDMSVTPTLLIRMIFLVFMGVYLLLKLDKPGLLMVSLVALAGILSMVTEYFFAYSYNMFVDFQYISRFMYNILAILVYMRAFDKRSHQDILDIFKKFFVWTGTIIGFSFVISFLTGFGFYTYQDRFGRRGTSGFYYSANEVAALLMVILPLCIVYFLEISPTRYVQKKYWMVLLAPSLIINSMLLIGTKTTFLSLALFMAIIFVYAFVLMIKGKSAMFLRMLLLSGSVILVFLLLTILSSAKSITTVISSFSTLESKLNEQHTEEYITAISEIYDESQVQAILQGNRITQMIFSGRDFYLSRAAKRWFHGNLAIKLFGLGRSSQNHIIEMDPFEMFFYYGIFGFICLSWLYAKKLWFLFSSFFSKPRNFFRFATVLSVLVCGGYLFIAGHVLFSVTGGFYLAMVLVYSKYVFDEKSLTLGL